MTNSREKWQDVSWQELRDRDVQQRIEVIKRPVCQPKTPGQSVYLDTIKRSDITFCVGPAGSGKTHVPLAYALQRLYDQQIEKIVLIRPIQECGRRMGDFPGDPVAKILPYFRPFLDLLYDIVGPNRAGELLKSEQVTLSPLELMRGSTLKNCVVLADETQNTTRMQMTMLLTRLGEGCQMIVVGDPHQPDLAVARETTIEWAMRLLDHERIGEVILTEADIVRSDLVGYIIKTLRSE